MDPEDSTTYRPNQLPETDYYWTRTQALLEDFVEWYNVDREIKSREPYSDGTI